MDKETTLFQNPLSEANQPIKAADSCILVIFGATGDLTARKLIPAIYNLGKDGQLPAHFACVGMARREKSNLEFRQEMKEAIKKYSRTKECDENFWQSFCEKLFYHTADFDGDEGYESLKKLLSKLDSQFGTKGNRVFYLSTQPSYFTTIVEKISQHGLIKKANAEKEHWGRVIIEKPFGRDLKSAKELQQELSHYLNESQIYRIDHYLGKETVQNLLVFRFGNPIFEAIWNSHYIDNIQITVGEEIGIGTRGNFWEEAGLVRDIIQNHLMQLLTLVAMEPPANLDASSIRDEKVKVLQSIRALDLSNIDSCAVRGQYGPGFINGEAVEGYREENNVSKTSIVETFAALKLSIDNWRWSGVPFYLRAGKRLPKRSTKIVITFKKAPGFLFADSGSIEPNILGIRIQPNEGIALKINCKVPALNTVIQPVKMNFQYSSYFGAAPPDAYERLICDCMTGDNTLFARDDEVFGSWQILSPLLTRWQEAPIDEFPNYLAGTWGPKKASEMLAKDGRSWRLV